MLVNGKWQQNWHPVQAKDEKGGFVRQQSSFRNRISDQNNARFPAQTGRYHLYVAAICPWANRTLIARKLKGLEDVISISVVEPFLGDQGWGFGNYPGSDFDDLNGAKYMHEIYTQAAPQYTGRATVPVLWDKKAKTIVNNESSDILRIFNSDFGSLASTAVDLFPKNDRDEIEQVNKRLYHSLNNGVYRAGFATTQVAYEEAIKDVFDALNWLDSRLAKREYLVGKQLSEADIRAFVTLIRFEPAYFGLFKCNQKHLWQYENIWSYLQHLYAIPSFHETVNFDHIKQGYYSIKALNPNGIVPIGSEMEIPKMLTNKAA